ncbi:FtsW/RodA/SpoVE family cell cycle protein [Paenibacillus aquistagni]|uniref:Cell division protein FtsW, lipid II flippase n=1 Tax=Paenibacillus aquistagni TaxID=1852522 RepID=A0A1X7LS20_9BACL|nr:FtsW/RodA/SpoVE family cell cycle protein [Paenibacillus aquistagni]SMG56284.1 cell division protein FtsW, lipid II flippase [Paenibacillus aquistagni]
MNTIRDQYLSNVCQHIQAKDMHEDIRNELLTHWDELVQDALDNGCPRENVEALVLQQMGDPEEIGRSFNQVHRPKMNWGLLITVGILVILGIAVSYYSTISLDYANLVAHKIFYSIIGLAIMLAVIFLDYRMLKKYSWVWFMLPFVIHAAVKPWIITMNGQELYLAIGSFSINLILAYSILLLIGISGILQQESTSKWRHSLSLMAITLLPLFLFSSANVKSYYLVYLVALLAVLWKSLKSKVYFYIVTGLHTLVASLYIFMFSSRPATNRILSFLSQDENYSFMLGRSRSAILSGGWWGQGIQDSSQEYPLIYSEYAISYIFHSLGWIIGALCLVVIGYVIVQFIRMSKQVKDNYGRTIITGLAAYIGFQYVYNILMIFGLAPQAGISPPIISYGGTYSVLTLAIIGLMLSIYRRKDMIPHGVQVRE